MENMEPSAWSRLSESCMEAFQVQPQGTEVSQLSQHRYCLVDITDYSFPIGPSLWPPSLCSPTVVLTPTTFGAPPATASQTATSLSTWQ